MLFSRQRRAAGQQGKSIRRRRSFFESLEPRLTMAANLQMVGAELVDLSGTPLTRSVAYGEMVSVRARWQTTDLGGTPQYVTNIEVDGVAVDTAPITGGFGVNVAVSRILRGWYPEPGTHTVKITLDGGDTIAETSESDNTLEFTFTTVAPIVQKFIWPLEGEMNRDWSILSYVDVDPRAGLSSDYNGGVFTTNGSTALNIAAANFRQMDEGLIVRAAAAGTVVQVVDNNFDRQKTPGPGVTNLVRLSHGNGWETTYALLAKDSVTVQVGNTVIAGQVLGLVGNSGDVAGSSFNTQPQLYFQVTHDGIPVETLVSPNSYWTNAAEPEYQVDSPVGVIDFGTSNTDASIDDDDVERFNAVDQFPINFAGNAYNGSVWFYAHLSHLAANEQVDVQWISPNGAIVATNSFTALTDTPQTLHSVQQQRVWARGGWQAVLLVNGVEKVRSLFTVDQAVPEIRLVAPGFEYVLDERTTPISMGTVSAFGSPTTRTFTIQNVGFSPLTVSNFSLPAGYSMVNLPFSNIAAGAQANFTVRLDTTQVGRKFGEITFTTNDPDEGTFSFNVEGLVQGLVFEPTVSLPSSEVAYRIDTAAVLIDPAATVFIPDASVVNGELVVSFASGSRPGDVLRVRNQGNGQGQINTNGSTIGFGNTTIGASNSPLDGEPLIITFNSSATQAAVEAVLRNVTYINRDRASTLNPRTLSVTLENSIGQLSAAAYKTIVPWRTDPTNLAPAITRIANQAFPEDGQLGPLRFAISDVETSAPSLVLDAASDNLLLFPLGSITLGGTGNDRTITLLPAQHQFGSATITMFLQDERGVLTTDTFLVTVVGVNDFPTITNLGNITINENTSTGQIPFVVGDVETPVGSLTVSAVSNNPALVAASGIVFGTISGENRTITINPSPDQSGTATITVTVRDGNNAPTSDTFLITVLPTTGNIPPHDISLSRQVVISQELGATVGTVEFTDPNVGDTHTFFLSDARFEVVDNVLKLKANEQIDMAFEPTINLSITVTDAAMASGTESFTLTVTDNEFPWQNPMEPLDVDGDGEIVALDVLNIINEINNTGGGPLAPPTGSSFPPPYLDVNADNFLTSLDALIVINWLNANPAFAAGEGEGEAAGSTYVASTIATPSMLYQLLDSQLPDVVAPGASESDASSPASNTQSVALWLHSTPDRELTLAMATDGDVASSLAIGTPSESETDAEWETTLDVLAADVNELP